MARQYATVRNATPADLAAALETNPTTSLVSVTYSVTSSAGDDVGFSIDGLTGLSVPATSDAAADATSLVAAWLGTPTYAALVSTPSRVVDHEDGTFTVIYADQLAHAFVNESTGANAVSEAPSGGDLTLLSAEVANGGTLPFTGDAGPFAVVPYSAEEAKVRKLLGDFVDWPLLDSATQDELAKFIAAKDLELGELLQGMVLISGWKGLAVFGATPVQKLMQQQLHTSYAASAVNNGALYLAKELIERIPDSEMDPAFKAQSVAAIDYHTQVKWPRPVDPSPNLPAQVVEETADFTYSVYVPVYFVDASGGDITVTLPLLRDIAVLPYWYTRIVCRPNGNTITFAPSGGETIDGAASLVVTTNRTIVPAGGLSEWKNAE